tara:strand:- start:3679 stop:5061 length:1383 start_codon:yes stop_codon:yes gene_type:complete
MSHIDHPYNNRQNDNNCYYRDFFKNRKPLSPIKRQTVAYQTYNKLPKSIYNSHNKSYNKTLTTYNDVLYPKKLEPIVLPSINSIKTPIFKLKSSTLPNLYKKKLKSTTEKYKTVPIYTSSLPPSNIIPKIDKESIYKSKYPLSKYPNLNPMFNLHDFKDHPLTTMHSKDWDDSVLSDIDENIHKENEIDELWYQYQQRNWIKNKSKEILDKVSLNKNNNTKDNLSEGYLSELEPNSDSESLSDMDICSIVNNEYSDELVEYDSDLSSSRNLSDSECYKSNIAKLEGYTSDGCCSNNSNSDRLEKDLSDHIISLEDINCNVPDNLENIDLVKSNKNTNQPMYINVIPKYVGEYKNIESIYNIDQCSNVPKIIIHEETSTKNKDIINDIIKEITEAAIHNSLQKLNKDTLPISPKPKSTEITKDIQEDINKDTPDNVSESNSASESNSVYESNSVSNWCSIM